MAKKISFGVDVDNKGFQTGMASIEMIAARSAAKISQTFTRHRTSPLDSTFGQIVSVAAVTKLTKDTISWASALRDAADEMGVNVMWLQKMENGAKLAGAKLGDLGKFVGVMNQSRQEALNNPDGKNAQAFSRLGISSAEIAGLSTQDFFQKLVESFKGGATVQMVNDISEVGGKSARNLIAAFSNQFSSDTPILAEEFIDQLDSIGDSMTDLKTQLMVGVAPAIVTVVGWLKSFIGTIQELGAFISGFVMEALILGDGNKENIGGQMALEVEEENKRRDAAIAAGRDAEKKARRARENSSPLFTPEEIKLKDVKEGKSRSFSPYTDSLLSVGNFLGAGRSMVGSIEQQTLDEVKAQGRVQVEMAKDIKKTAENTKPSNSTGGTMEVPG